MAAMSKAAEAAARIRAHAETERNRAQDGQSRAERAQAVAEARLTDAQDAATRADRRTSATVDRAEHLEQQLAGLRAELLNTQQALEEERQRHSAEETEATFRDLRLSVRFRFE